MKAIILTEKLAQIRLFTEKSLVLLIFMLFFCSRTLLFGQGEINTQPQIFYRDEKSLGLLLNSNGFGAGFRYGKWLDDRNKKIWEADLVSLKNPKEIKYPYLYYTNSRSFIYGKLNTVFVLRGMRGHQYEIFRKVDQGGISIKYFYSAGMSLALYKPIYYDVYVVDTGYYLKLESHKFDPSLHPSQYAGRSSFFKGFDELKALPGLSARLGISFDYSTKDALLHALEAGIVIDAFPKKIPIMATKRNNAVFLTLFVSYRFGRIIDRLKGKEWKDGEGTGKP